MRKETERMRERDDSHIRAYPLAATGQRCYRNRPALALMVGAALMIAPAIASGKAAPCKAHPAEASPGKVDRATCLAAHKRQRARDRMPWPPNPSVPEIRRRVDRIGGPGTYAKAWRVARCETGANPRHFPNGRWIGMLGMYRSTYAYGARATGYPFPHVATPQQQIAVAIAAWPITRGWSGWGCGGA
jgi:hypothetical protein